MYVAAFEKSDIQPPLARVITEKQMEVLFISFVTSESDERLLTAVYMSVDLWIEEAGWSHINKNALFLLVALTHKKCRPMFFSNRP